MSTNCLVTKLKATVNNPELYGIDEYRGILSDTSVRFGSGGFGVPDTSVTVKVTGGYMTIPGSSEHLTEYTIENTNTFGGGAGSITFVKTAQNDEPAFVSVYPYTNFLFIRLNPYGIWQKLSKFAFIPRLGQLTAGPLYGDISSLNGNIALNTLTLGGMQSVTGSAESLFEAQFSNGRTSGNFTINCYSKKISFHDYYMGDPGKPSVLTATFSASGITVKNNNSVTIATYDGSAWTYV